MKRSTLIGLAVFGAALLVALSASAGRDSAPLGQIATGTGITYQGRLLDAASNPINGSCSMTFTLWTASTGGSQVGSAVVVTGVAMSNGYFATSLDFGSAVWNGDARWLEPVAACNGGGDEMFDRQAVTVVPYAVRSLNPTPTPLANVAYTNTANVFTTTQTIHANTASVRLLTLRTLDSNTTNDMAQAQNLSGNRVAWLTGDGRLIISDITTGLSTAKFEATRYTSAALSDPEVLRAQMTFSGGTGSVTGNARAIYAIVDANKNSPGTLGTIDAAYFWTKKNGTATANSISGFGMIGSNEGTGNISSLRGGYFAIGSSGSATITHGALIDLLQTTTSAGRFQNFYGVRFSQSITSGTGDIQNVYGMKIGSVTSGSIVNYSIYGETGQYHFGDTVEVSGTIKPVISGTSDLGTSALAWNQVHAREYVTHSYGDWSAGVTLRNQTVVSCSVAIEKLKKHPTKLTPSGRPHINYEDPEFPIDAYVPPVDEWVTRILTGTITPTLPLSSTIVSVTPVHNEQGEWTWNEYIVKILLPGESAANMDVLSSIMLCATREMETRRVALDVRLTNILTRTERLEQIIGILRP